MFIITNILVLFKFYYINYYIFEIVALNFLLKKKRKLIKHKYLY